MKALTVYQPWASLIACGSKTLETRRWATKYRGPLAIHAAKRPYKHSKHHGVAEFFYGAFVCLVNLDDVRLSVPEDEEAAECYITPGFFVWEISVQHTFAPVPCMGARRIWNVPESMVPELQRAPFVDPPMRYQLERILNRSKKLKP